jgi:hypothetical protein
LDANIRRGWGLPEFVGRDSGWNEDHALQLQLPDGIARQNQMPMMNGVERATEDANRFQYRVKSCFAVRRQK